MTATPNRRTDMTFDLGTSTMRDILQTADPEITSWLLFEFNKQMESLQTFLDLVLYNCVYA